MNCQKHDLAIVVRTSPLTCDLRGLIVTVETLVHTAFGPLWRVAGTPALCPHCGGPVNAIFDADLQPIRPPPLGVTTEQRDEVSA